MNIEKIKFLEELNKEHEALLKKESASMRDLGLIMKGVMLSKPFVDVEMEEIEEDEVPIVMVKLKHRLNWELIIVLRINYYLIDEYDAMEILYGQNDVDYHIVVGDTGSLYFEEHHELEKLTRFYKKHSMLGYQKFRGNEEVFLNSEKLKSAFKEMILKMDEEENGRYIVEKPESLKNKKITYYHKDYQKVDMYGAEKIIRINREITDLETYLPPKEVQSVKEIRGLSDKELSKFSKKKADELNQYFVENFISKMKEKLEVNVESIGFKTCRVVPCELQGKSYATFVFIIEVDGKREYFNFLTTSEEEIYKMDTVHISLGERDSFYYNGDSLEVDFYQPLNKGFEKINEEFIGYNKVMNFIKIDENWIFIEFLLAIDEIEKRKYKEKMLNENPELMENVEDLRGVIMNFPMIMVMKSGEEINVYDKELFGNYSV